MAAVDFIGLVVAYLDTQFYPVALERLSKQLLEQGYHTLVFMVSDAAGEIDRAVEELLDYQVEGIATASVSMNSALTERCAQAGIPVVMFNRRQQGTAFSSVTSANVEGGRRVARPRAGLSPELEEERRNLLAEIDGPLIVGKSARIPEGWTT